MPVNKDPNLFNNILFYKNLLEKYKNKPGIYFTNTAINLLLLTLPKIITQHLVYDISNKPSFTFSCIPIC